MIPASEALERLRDGNRRFVGGKLTSATSVNQAKRLELAAGQQPFAAIVACSDSRVPVELLFDQGPGDLFVIRVAGNIAAPSQIGSVEYAAAHLGTRLVVVLGHSNCGAVDAAMQEVAKRQSLQSPNLRAIVDRIRPALEPLGDVTLHDAVIANVRRSVDRLKRGSQVLERMTEAGELKVVGAEYSIESGEVTFLDDQ
ncbi:MAG: carbonic anhydrase [Proteobacteria bacterium]|nr:carbonic anhydrase [Pseudomonadota bacterium]